MMARLMFVSHVVDTRQPPGPYTPENTSSPLAARTEITLGVISGMQRLPYTMDRQYTQVAKYVQIRRIYRTSDRHQLDVY